MFLLIPIGHEDSRVNRFPVVSITIVVLCLIAFAMTWPRASRESDELTEVMTSLLFRSSGLMQAEELEAIDDPEDDGSRISGDVEELMMAEGPQEFLDKVERALEKREAEDREEGRYASMRADIARARQLLSGGVFHEWGLVASGPRFHSWVTHMFLHGGYLHLIFNLIFFLLCAPALENLWGRIVFPIAYILGGLAAAIGFILVSGPIRVPMVGASGAIAGLMGAFLIAFTHTRIKMCCMVFVGLPRVFTFHMPALVFFPLWVGWEVFEALLQLGTRGAGGGGVAHWAHVWGFVFGVAVPFTMRWTKLDQKLFPVYSGRDGRKETRGADPALKYMHDPVYRNAVRLRDECQWPGAIEAFHQCIEHYPDAVGPRIELAETHRQDGDPRSQRETLLAALDVAVKTKDLRLLEIYEAVRRDSPVLNLSGDCLYRVGVAFEAAGMYADAMEHLRRFLKQCPDHPLRGKAAARLANVLAGPMNDQSGARAILGELRDKSADPLQRRELEAQLKELDRTTVKSLSQ